MVGLLPGVPPTADGDAARMPPPMIMAPGLPPERKSRLVGIVTPAAGWLTRVEYPRAKPEVATFTRLGEKTCVSCKLMLCISSSEVAAQFGAPPPPPPPGP